MFKRPRFKQEMKNLYTYSQKSVFQSIRNLVFRTFPAPILLIRTYRRPIKKNAPRLSPSFSKLNSLESKDGALIIEAFDSWISIIPLTTLNHLFVCCCCCYFFAWVIQTLNCPGHFICLMAPLNFSLETIPFKWRLC